MCQRANATQSNAHILRNTPVHGRQSIWCGAYWLSSFIDNVALSGSRNCIVTIAIHRVIHQATHARTHWIVCWCDPLGLVNGAPTSSNFMDGNICSQLPAEIDGYHSQATLAFCQRVNSGKHIAVYCFITKWTVMMLRLLTEAIAAPLKTSTAQFRDVGGNGGALDFLLWCWWLNRIL